MDYIQAASPAIRGTHKLNPAVAGVSGVRAGQFKEDFRRLFPSALAIGEAADEDSGYGRHGQESKPAQGPGRRTGQQAQDQQSCGFPNSPSV
jgi:hypothetical protein